MIDPVKQIIIVRKDLIDQVNEKMTLGKMGAQISHASMAPILEKMYGSPFEERGLQFKGLDNYTLELEVNNGDAIKTWLEGNFTKIVLYVKSEEKLLNIYNELRQAGIIACLIKDDAKTIFSEPTITCLGIEPLEHSVINPFVKRLRLL